MVILSDCLMLRVMAFNWPVCRPVCTWCQLYTDNATGIARKRINLIVRSFATPFLTYNNYMLILPVATHRPISSDVLLDADSVHASGNALS